MDKPKITIETTVNATIERVWEWYTVPSHIVKWNHASDDWHTTRVENDLRKGGKFLSRMEAKDGSFGFDFWGVYDEVMIHEVIEYTMGDARKAHIQFFDLGAKTKVAITFEAEAENEIELQRTGWQAILNNFKKYVETN